MAVFDAVAARTLTPAEGAAILMEHRRESLGLRALKAVFVFALAALCAFAAAGLLSGCARPLEVAIVSANSAQRVLVESKVVITAACVPAYERAQGAAEVAAVDARCVPAGRAYDALRAAWVTAVAAIGIAQARGTEAELGPAVAELGRGLELMHASLKGLPR